MLMRGLVAQSCMINEGSQFWQRHLGWKNFLLGKHAIKPCASRLSLGFHPFDLPSLYLEWLSAFHPAFAVQQRFAFRQKQPVGLSWVFDKSRPSGTDP
jgi:hypothetical protein